MLHHAPFPNAVVEPWNWNTKSVWYFFMEECRDVPLNTVIGSMSPIELNHITDQLLVVLKDMRSYTSTMIGSVTGGPYNNRFMPYPRQPPHAFSSIQEYLDYYRSIFLDWATFSPRIFSSKAPRLQGSSTGRPPATIPRSGNIAGCTT